MSDDTSLSILVSSEAKVGKTWLAATCPKPLLILDSEGGSRFLPMEKKVWDIDAGGPPPECDVVIAYVRRYQTVQRAYQWLANMEHPFKSVAIDSLTEVQKRVIDQLTSSDPDMDIEQVVWGKVFRHLEDLIRKMRDLTFHPQRPLKCVYMSALVHMKDGKLRPLVKGQLAMTLPGFPDVIGYLHVASTEDGTLERRLAIQPVWPHVLAGDRTHVLTQKLGAVISKPHIRKMIEAMDDKEEANE